MDITDRKLLQILERNARITYRELSDQLKISIPSIQKRIVALESSGIIQGYIANINLRALGGSVVLVQGTSTCDFSPEVIDALGENDSIMTVACGGQSLLSMAVFLRDLSELDSIISFIKEVGKIPEPEVLMINQESDITSTKKISKNKRPDASQLTNLDYRIINALHDNARKSISDVAAEVGVSSKTVSIRLEKMIERGLIDFHIVSFPNGSDDIVVVIFAHLKPNAARQKVIEVMRKHPACFVDEDVSFSNAPNLILFTLEMENMSQLFELLAQIKDMEEVEGVTHDVVIYQKYFETWRDKLLRERASQGPIQKPSR